MRWNLVYEKLRVSYFLASFLMLFLSIGVYAQNFTVVGSVLDETGEPVVGANVVIKGTTTGRITDASGMFTFPNIKKGTLFLVSFIGMENQEVVVSDNKPLVVRLEATSQSLDDVVVIGYGQSTKRDVTGAMAKVDMKDVLKAPVASITDALSGRIAGVQVMAGDGQPGSDAIFTIRGNNSITGDNSPLYVVDGFPMESFNFGSMPPEDVESIEVLKDASATAIYGARGANGVVIITTKRGKEGKVNVSYDGSYGVQQVRKHMALLSPYEFVKMRMEFDPIKTTANYLNNGELTLDYYKDVKGLDFQDYIFQDAPMQSHNVAMRGGTEATRYSTSLNYLSQEGVIINGGFNRFQGKVSLDQTISKKFKTGLVASFGETKRYGQSPSETTAFASVAIMSDVWGYRPVGYIGEELDDLLDSNLDPTDDVTTKRFNPYSNLINLLEERKDQNLTANGYLEFSITKDLKLRSSAGITKIAGKSSNFYNSNTKSGNPLAYNQVNGSVNNSESQTWLNENILTYTKKLKSGHRYTAMGGFTAQGAKAALFGAKAIQVPQESLGISGLDLGTPLSIVSTSTGWTLASFLGRVNYDYKSRYLVTMSMRADGSSRFAPKNRWSYFPSGSLAWRISEEPLVKKNLKYLSDAKLRASWGVTGNNRVGDFASLAQLNGTFYYNGTDYKSVMPTSMSNKDLRWENTAQTNIGLDLGLLKQRVSITTDVYRKVTYDLLLNSRLPGSTGYTSAMKNVGKVQNQGLEFTLNTINVRTKSFEWSSNFNIAFNRSKVLDLAEGQTSLSSVVRFESNYSSVPAYIAIKGQPIAQIMGYVSDGCYQEEDFERTANGDYILKDNVPNSTTSRSNKLKPGFVKLKDLNGDGVMTTSDYTIIGNPNPVHIGGFSNTFVYAGFDLNIFFQWSYGNDILNANRIKFESSKSDDQFYNKFATYADRWTPENTDATIPVVGGSQIAGFFYESKLVEDGSYLRLKTACLGYSLPVKVLKVLKMSKLRMYVSGQNLWTLTNYSGYDPEVNSRPSALTPGWDFSTYPRAITVTCGINAVF